MTSLLPSRKFTSEDIMPVRRIFDSAISRIWGESGLTLTALTNTIMHGWISKDTLYLMLVDSRQRNR